MPVDSAPPGACDSEVRRGALQAAPGQLGGHLIDGHLAMGHPNWSVERPVGSGPFPDAREAAPDHENRLLSGPWASALGGNRTPNLLIRRATEADPAGVSRCRRALEFGASRAVLWTWRHAVERPVTGRSDTSLIHHTTCATQRVEGKSACPWCGPLDVRLVDPRLEEANESVEVRLADAE